ncbi:hypothetical protein MEG1DRAFT_02851 [Photorhabdus temperata subsp. temperata Meg1]|uniref:Uncharacterized protein n=1 Tax=Photorhabdus temperata subsp. temperata Meg1 TaxID=1393735 RepID=A0A081RV12_PHOTE|nr:hypothetical protein MEG1DRAFT_02851 [Photorhabdus temperata subsp. temperata Meg1]
MDLAESYIDYLDKQQPYEIVNIRIIKNHIIQKIEITSHKNSLLDISYALYFLQFLSQKRKMEIMELTS